MTATTNRSPMVRSLDIFADMILTFNGEDFIIKASKGSIKLSSPSVSSGLRALLSLGKQHKPFRNMNRFDTALKDLGWTLYAHIGIFDIAVLGSRGRRGILKALFMLGRIGRILGVI